VPTVWAHFRSLWVRLNSRRAGWRAVLTEDADVRGARDVGASQPVHVLGTTTVARAVGRVDTQPSLRAHRLRLPVHDLTITHHTIMHWLTD